jgi:hypothetical protein
VKATSSAARLAPAILSRNGTRAIYLNQRAESAIATLLAGQNSPLDLRGHGPGRCSASTHALSGRAHAPPVAGRLARDRLSPVPCARRDILARAPDRSSPWISMATSPMSAAPAACAGTVRAADRRSATRFAAGPGADAVLEAPGQPTGRRCEPGSSTVPSARAENQRGLAWLAGARSRRRHRSRFETGAG